MAQVWALGTAQKSQGMGLAVGCGGASGVRDLTAVLWGPAGLG